MLRPAPHRETAHSIQGETSEHLSVVADKEVEDIYLEPRCGARGLSWDEGETTNIKQVLISLRRKEPLPLSARWWTICQTAYRRRFLKVRVWATSARVAHPRPLRIKHAELDDRTGGRPGPAVPSSPTDGGFLRRRDSHGLHERTTVGSGR